jgi:hypothetical protein
VGPTPDIDQIYPELDEIDEKEDRDKEDDRNTLES